MSGSNKSPDGPIKPYDECRLEGLVNAYEKVNQSPIDYETAKDLLGRVRQLRYWLNAEKSHQNGILRWLEAEKQWQINQALVNSDEIYRAAAHGWDAMRELSPRLDGVATFGELGTLLMNRYAAFAKAVLDAEEER
ncbi:hypothetical protein BKG87_22280 [Mycobacteroides chelonae]|nr:hypothetical protein BKG87_22280 [Mycobacteroides chelonae]